MMVPNTRAHRGDSVQDSGLPGRNPGGNPGRNTTLILLARAWWRRVRRSPAPAVPNHPTPRRRYYDSYGRSLFEE
jgi:hypothetical protein